jgi:hypothetical protein
MLGGAYELLDKDASPELAIASQPDLQQRRGVKILIDAMLAVWFLLEITSLPFRSLGLANV